MPLSSLVFKKKMDYNTQIDNEVEKLISELIDEIEEGGEGGGNDQKECVTFLLIVAAIVVLLSFLEIIVRLFLN